MKTLYLKQDKQQPGSPWVLCRQGEHEVSMVNIPDDVDDHVAPQLMNNEPTRWLRDDPRIDYGRFA